MSNQTTFFDLVNESKSRITSVDVDKAEHMLSEGYKVLDIREPHEHETKNIPSSINIPRGVLEPAACIEYEGANPVLRDGRDDGWLVLCATGGRAALATDTLQSMGFNNVSCIEGGLDAWEQANKELAHKPTATHQ